MQSFLPEAALADIAYNQALVFQLLHRNTSAAALTAAAQNPLANANANAVTSGNPLLNPNGNGISPVPGTNSSNASGAVSTAGLESDFGLNPDSFEPPIETDLYPTTLYSCLICANFNTNQIDELNQHLLIDRSRTSSTQNQQDVMLIINNNYICRLCNYKTTLKANFQLHSKTDKHIQKLNYINHIKEGGASNEYKLKYNSNNTVQLKCNCCDYYTNSIQKLNLHTQNVRHESMKIIFNHLVQSVVTCASTSNDNDDKVTTSSPKVLGAAINETNSDDVFDATADKLNESSENVADNSSNNDQQRQSTQPNSDQTDTDMANDGNNEHSNNQTISVKSTEELNDTMSKAGSTTGATAINFKNTDDLIEDSTKENNDNNNSASQNPTTASNINSNDTNNKVIVCQLCNFKANHILGMVQHVKSLQHMQIEHLICVQRVKENLDSLELTDVFTVAETGKSFVCSYFLFILLSIVTLMVFRTTLLQTYCLHII